MDTQQIDPTKINEIHKMSDEIYNNISSAAKEITQINYLAKKEIRQTKLEIAKDELKEQSDEIFAETDMQLSPEYITNQSNILKDLYLQNNYKELLGTLNDATLFAEYEKAIESLPKNYKLWGVVWRLTRAKKKEEIFKKVEKVQALNEKFGSINQELTNELLPDLELSNEQLWEDFEANEEEYYSGLQKLYGVNKASISKEDFKEHQNTYNDLKEFYSLGEIAFQRYQESFQRVKNLIRKENEEQLEQELHLTSLDDFRKLYPDSSLRLQLLAQSGIRTVGEMDEYPSFLSISGVGNVTNEKIKFALHHYKEEVNQSLGLHFEPESKTKNHTEILRNLYLRVNDKQLNKDMEKIELQMNQMNLYSLLNEVFIRSEWSMQQLDKNELLMEEHQNKVMKLADFATRSTPIIQEFVNQLREILKLTEDEIWSNFNTNAADYYAVLERDFGVGSANVEDTIKRSGLSEEIIRDIKKFELNEEGLNATLRSWQDFGAKYSLIQKKVLIGDEMGLGKTLISIAGMTHLSMEDAKNKFLVICPASIMTNWERELEKFSDLKVYRTHGNYRDSLLEAWKETGGVAITTYETSLVLDFEDMDSIDMITVDEAHYVKNPDAKRTKGVRELTRKSEYALYLTGTPLENKVSEMTEIIRPLNASIAQSIRKPRVSIHANKYRKKIAPVYLRRTKEDVSLELPPLTQIEEWEEFGDEEFEEYKDAVAHGKFMRMRRAAWVGGTPSKSPKLERLLELTNEAYENDNKVIVFTFFRDVISTVVDALGERVVEPIHGGVPVGQRQEIIDEFRESDTKNVLVAQINTAAHGLNIQFANTIIFCEPQIKPSLESQAVARAYRMGQVDNVFVYRLLTVNSIDELMMEMLGNKQALFDQFADRSYLQEELAGGEETEDKKSENIQSKIIDLESARLNIERVSEDEKEVESQ